ncbi:hypothetical protein CesoFtcFv8_007714 [Champsocephalus esox]|uniref:Uncharacterized protein n=1 Tax=Champsocephalus esox TaxID=159716 RepID=A0AAN8H4R2_9TELE|nr:hypothetical protein CesoFtcFv8_007714 [Champsocephalus esox]
MCTGTPHCGSGVHARDELHIPTSGILAPPLLPSLPPWPTRSSAVCRSLRLHMEEKKTKPALCFAPLGDLKALAGRGGLNQDRHYRGAA